MQKDRDRRLNSANELLITISSCGHRFFEYRHDDGNTEVAKFTTRKGRVYLWSEWKRIWIYVNEYRSWPNFHHGGTLHALVGRLVEYIKTGEKLYASQFNDHWDYGDDINIILDKGRSLDLFHPHRVQRKRTKGWRMPKDTISVARPGRWGNPYKAGELVHEQALRDPIIKLTPNCLESAVIKINNNKGAMDAYEAYLLSNPDLIAAVKKELAGKNLACFCKLNEPCHGDVLLRVANS